MILDCAGRPLDLAQPGIMGVLNITPDSFSDGGVFFSRDKAAAHAVQMVQAGAAVIDVGGESTRPGAAPVPLAEELRRVIPVIEAVRDAVSVPISIDTHKPEVMQAAVAAGAGMVNDVRALQDAGAVEMVAALGVPVCLMHMQGTPASMQAQPSYDDVVAEVSGFLEQRAGVCIQQGIPREHILLDPGFGFGKTTAHNLLLLQRLDHLVATGFPVLVGLSRKSMIGDVTGLAVAQRLQPSVALAVLAVWKGAAIVRCHDVQETREAVLMCQAVRDAGQPAGGSSALT